MKTRILIASLLALAGCATSRLEWITFPDEATGKGVSLDAWLTQHPLAPGQEIAFHEIARTEGSSTHLVQIRTEEKLHAHQKHDLVAIVLKGNGTLTLGDRHLYLKAGGVVTIPRGVPHAFQNRSKAPAVAYVVFTPAFDGADTVPVQE